MKNKFFVYAMAVTMLSSGVSWTKFISSASNSTSSSGSSWSSRSGSGGSWGGGGGHK
ncbi:MAG: hypothetical protein Q7U12_15150 [Undibacterium sp.]|nr:hypothetical protein [Undibacterium sp.]MDO9194233.1 hypothetical protein [Undibacterium sp.]